MFRLQNFRVDGVNGPIMNAFMTSTWVRVIDT